MNSILSCCRPCNALAATRRIAAAALSLAFLAGLPVSGQAQSLSQTSIQEQSRSTYPLEIRDMPAQALFSQAVSLEREFPENPEKAIAKYDEVIQRYVRGTTPGTRQFAARAMLNKGNLLSKHDKDREAIVSYERVERNFSNEKSPAIREVLASSFVSKAEAFYKLGNVEKALGTYVQLGKHFKNDENDFIMRLLDITKWRAAEIRDINKLADAQADNKTISSRQ
jgi:tetratricopeptide (TPR) repeat protein